MAKRAIKDVEPEAEIAATPTTSKKRKISKEEDVAAPLPVKTRVRAPREKAALPQKPVAVEQPVAVDEPVKTKKPDVAEKPVVAEKRNLGDTDEATASKGTKKRKVSVNKEQTIAHDVPIVHNDYETWPAVLSILGRVTNARFNSAWPIYCYELEGQSPRWSWDEPRRFKNTEAIKKMQKKFNRTHHLGTAHRKEGSDELEEACREHAIPPPASSGALTISLKVEDGSVFAWFGTNGYTSDDPSGEVQAVSPDSSEQASELESRPKAPMKKKKTTEKGKTEIPPSPPSSLREASEVESRPKAPMKKTKTEKNKISSPSSPAPKASPKVESRPKIFTRKVEKDSLSPLRATSTESINVSEEEKDRVSSKERQLQQRIARDNRAARVQIRKPTLSLKAALMQKYSRYTHPAGATDQPLAIDPAETSSDCVYLVNNSRSSPKVSLHRNASMQTTILGLYRRQVSAANGKSPRTATYTAVYTQDTGFAVYHHEVEWFEAGEKQFYLIKWTETSTDGKEEEICQGFVAVEHLDHHVDYFPQIEKFEQEQMTAVYGEKDEAARRKREAARQKREDAKKKERME
ncbi:hypothetical protein EG328_008929 [Venturia inaequalis]|uniref:Chromo domain-containing protein n=1 Tax=Venturia inaequalis TaxID=5025 RepID=A0A8H3YNQ3_VENIN|nr:hypothetical protein EG328_008929 [Venturia inaequalis]RDI83135.1 hypothetical protein Vi05172_g6874 [Venturia inaequalis]